MKGEREWVERALRVGRGGREAIRSMGMLKSQDSVLVMCGAGNGGELPVDQGYVSNGTSQEPDKPLLGIGLGARARRARISQPVLCLAR